VLLDELNIVLRYGYIEAARWWRFLHRGEA
jgi:ATP:corrinoid adenosyltransferase